MSTILLDEVTEAVGASELIPEFTYAAIHITGTATVELSIMAGNKKVPLATVTESKVLYNFPNLVKPVVRAEVLNISAGAKVSVEV